MRAKVALVAGVAAALGVVVGYLLPRPDATEYDSVAYLVARLDERGLRCGGDLWVNAFSGVVPEVGPYENGGCPRFDGDDEGNFFTFPDESTKEAYLERPREDSGGAGVSGVVGSNWIVSVRLEATARRVQDAIGGEVVGY